MQSTPQPTTKDITLNTNSGTVAPVITTSGTAPLAAATSGTQSNQEAPNKAASDKPTAPKNSESNPPVIKPSSNSANNSESAPASVPPTKVPGPQSVKPSVDPKTAKEDEIKLNNSMKLYTLQNLCTDYSKHLELKGSHSTGSLLDRKREIIHAMEGILNNQAKNPGERIQNLIIFLTNNHNEKQNTLKQTRSGKVCWFFEQVLSVLTLGLFTKISKNAYSLFSKTHGDILVENINKETPLVVAPPVEVAPPSQTTSGMKI